MTDSLGQTSSDGLAVYVSESNRPPVAQCQDVAVATAAGVCEASASVDAGCFDPDGDAITLDQSPSGPYGLGSSAVTLTVDDDKGATDSCSATVTVIDEEPPVLACPASETAECTGGGAAEVSFSPTVSDNCNAAVSTTCSPASGSSFPLGTTTVSCDVTDGAGNSSNCAFGVSVVDTTPPSITAPADVVAECEGPGGTSVSLGTPVASDTCTTVTLSNDAPGSFPPGATSVTWTATDAEGNSATAIQTVGVEDTTAPELTLAVAPDLLWPPNHKLIEVVPTVTASDSCDAAPELSLVAIVMNEGDGTLTYDPTYDATVGDGHTINDIQVDRDGHIFLRAERSGIADGRVYSITYRATDASGNESIATATVTVPHNQ